MQFILKVDIDNAAFDGQPELSRILVDLADTLACEDQLSLCHYQNLHDINGNTVGKWAIK